MFNHRLSQAQRRVSGERESSLLEILRGRAGMQMMVILYTISEKLRDRFFLTLVQQAGYENLLWTQDDQ